MLVDLVEPFGATVVTELVDFLSKIVKLGVVVVIALVAIVVVSLSILYLQCRNNYYGYITSYKKTLYLQRKCSWLFTLFTLNTIIILNLTFNASPCNWIT